MNSRHVLYLIFLVIYLLIWGLIPFEKDAVHPLASNGFCVDFVVRSFSAIMLSALFGFCAIEAIFILKKRLRSKALSFLSGIALIFLSAASFFISGQNLEVSCNAERVTERLWFFKIRDVVVANQDLEPVSIIGNYTDKGCFRYYHYSNQDYKVFRGLGFAFNLSEVVY